VGRLSQLLEKKKIYLLNKVEVENLAKFHISWKG
jgi:hypothetical protein